MKRIPFVLLLFFSCTLFAQENSTDEEQIKQVVQSAYIDGIQNRGDITAIKAGFHPGFNLLGVRNGMLTKLPIYSWVEYVEKAKAAGNEHEKVSAEFLMVDVSGDAAMVKLALYQSGKKIFTDYLSLYKFDDTWRIVSKIYHRH